VEEADGGRDDDGGNNEPDSRGGAEAQNALHDFHESARKLFSVTTPGVAGREMEMALQLVTYSPLAHSIMARLQRPIPTAIHTSKNIIVQPFTYIPALHIVFPGVGMLQQLRKPSRWALALTEAPTAAEYAVADDIGHFYGIDLLRGLAAIAILVWHYQHFFLTAPVTDSPPINHQAEPGYWLLWPLYEHGFWAVQLFWIISGFVFAHVYAGRITGAAAFASARFARLYPLHFITLIAVAILQSLSQRLTGHYQIVPINDAYDFTLNLLFISGWGFQHGLAFNIPIWSVSIEIAIYFVFFLMATRVMSLGFAIPLAVMTICGIVMNVGTPLWYFALCGFFFYLGVATFLFLLRFKRNTIAVLVVAGFSLAVFAALVRRGDAVNDNFQNANGFLFVPAVLIVGWLEFANPFRRTIRPLKWVGDATYSTYLWHFPMQVTILLVFTYCGLSRAIFYNWITLIVWVVGVVLLAHASYRCVEVPLQRLSKRLLRDAADAPLRQITMRDMRARQQNQSSAENCHDDEPAL